MEFCIAAVGYWEMHGFNITDWRKSVNDTLAIVHLDYAETLIPNIRQDTRVLILPSPSSELTELLNSSEWKVSLPCPM